MARVTLGVDTSGRPLVVDDRTLAKLRLAEARLGHTFVIVQGSWRGGSGATASAGTHDAGGVIDLRSWDIPATIGTTRAIRALREAGLIAWYRTQAQGFDPHIHAIDHGNPDLHPSAAYQVAEWKAGRNGLASRGPDDGPRVTIPTNPPEDTMNLRDLFRYKLRKDGTTFADMLRAIERDVRAIRQDVAYLREKSDARPPK